MNKQHFGRQFRQLLIGETSKMNKSQIELLDNSVSYFCEIEHCLNNEWKISFVINNQENNRKIFILETMRGNIRFFKKLQTAIEFILDECKKCNYLLIKKDNRIYKVQELEI